MQVEEILTKSVFLEEMKNLKASKDPEDPFKFIPPLVNKELAQFILGYKSIKSIEYQEKIGNLSRIRDPNVIGVKYPREQIIKRYKERLK